ncbi:MAG: hypothetical protein ACREAN_08210, partial [Nitrosopumilaceae archaeon]
MRCLVDISPETHAKVRELVEKGKYKDFDQFLEIATRNQIRAELDDNNLWATTLHYEATSPGVDDVVSTDISTRDVDSSSSGSLISLPRKIPVLVEVRNDPELYKYPI